MFAGSSSSFGPTDPFLEGETKSFHSLKMGSPVTALGHHGCTNQALHGHATLPSTCSFALGAERTNTALLSWFQRPRNSSLSPCVVREAPQSSLLFVSNSGTLNPATRFVRKHFPIYYGSPSTQQHQKPQKKRKQRGGFEAIPVLE